MRCVSCDRILTDTERLAYKYTYDESKPEVFVRTGEMEDMCHSCNHKMRESDSYINKDYAHSALTEGLSMPTTMSDYL